MKTLQILETTAMKVSDNITELAEKVTIFDAVLKHQLALGHCV